jgi:Ohr subfamily peroxiredoxin
VTGGRGGSARSQTGSLQVELARPAERGTENAGTDPEELFAAGFAACFDSALAGAARRERIAVGKTSTTAAVSLTRTPDERYAITVALDVQAPDCPQADLERAVAVAETMCPYANAIRGNVPLTLRATGRQ